MVSETTLSGAAWKSRVDANSHRRYLSVETCTMNHPADRLLAFSLFAISTYIWKQTPLSHANPDFISAASIIHTFNFSRKYATHTSQKRYLEEDNAKRWRFEKSHIKGVHAQMFLMDPWTNGDTSCSSNDHCCHCRCSDWCGAFKAVYDSLPKWSYEPKWNKRVNTWLPVD